MFLSYFRIKRRRASILFLCFFSPSLQGYAAVATRLLTSALYEYLLSQLFTVVKNGPAGLRLAALVELNSIDFPGIIGSNFRAVRDVLNTEFLDVQDVKPVLQVSSKAIEQVALFIKAHAKDAQVYCKHLQKGKELGVSFEQQIESALREPFTKQVQFAHGNAALHTKFVQSKQLVIYND